MNSISINQQIIIKEIRFPEMLNDLMPLLRQYGKYMYDELSLTAGKTNFENELIDFPVVKYSPPEGLFLVAYIEDRAVGCVGLKKFEEGACEIKRLYVLPEFRNLGIGKSLNAAIISKAKTLGYTMILLDTNAEMEAAVNLYRRSGFVEIPAYVENENPNVIYFSFTL